MQHGPQHSRLRNVRERTDALHTQVDDHRQKDFIMAIHHALSGEMIDIRPLGDAIKTSRTSMLYKTQHLEVFRLVLAAGKHMPEHSVVGEITVQCLEGSIEFSIGPTRDVMRSGDLKCLAGGVLHAVKALEDSTVLVTLLLHGSGCQ